nr:MAG TPA_asm: outer capsid protein sigma-1 attachment protein [Caudoviricetes sp.]
MTTYICKCGRRVKKSTDTSTTGNRLSGYAPGHECWGCPYAMPYGNHQWDESARTVSRETQGYECRMSKTLTYASEFAGSIKDKCTCRVHSLDFDFLSQVSAWIKDTYPDREIFGSFSKDIRASDYGSDGRYCLTITCAQNLKGVAAKRELLGQFFTPNGSRKDMTPQQEMEKILADIKKAKEGFSCAPAQNADAAVTTVENAVPTATAATPTTSERGADASASTPATSLQNCESVPAASAGGSSVPMPSAPGFDFSALGELSEQAVETDQQFDLHYGTAQDEYLISCIYVAKMHALTAKAGRYGGGTWTKWYESKGMSKSSVWNMLQTGEGFKGSTVEQLTSIPELSRKDLNLIARSGCAEQLTAAAGDSQRVQELLAQLKAKEYKLNETQARLKSACIQEQESRDAMNTANAQLEAANADIKGLTEQNDQLRSRLDAAEAREEEAWKMQSKAEARAKNAEGQLSGSRQVAEAAKLRADKLQEENAALKKQPIAAVVDEEEVERRANQRAHDIAEDLAAEMTADLQARLEQVSSGSEQDARDAYDSIILAGRSITSIVQSVKMQFRKLPDDQRETAINQFVHTLASAQGEVSACL